MLDCDGCNQAAIPLMPENLRAWDLWNAVNTQWRTAGTLEKVFFIGLDYSAVYATADILGLEITPAMLHKIQALESFEIKRLNKERDEA